MGRAVLESAQILRERGYHIGEFDFPDKLAKRFISVFINLLAAEGSWKSFKVVNPI
jgi:hypothetical protein